MSEELINSHSWGPSATMLALRLRSKVYRAVRDFFESRNVLEVETPILGRAAAIDPFIDSLTTAVMGENRYLQTSPEFFLKRLLAANSGDIYSLGKVFRQGESGRRHHPEFTMLEWYRISWDEHQLMDEVADLISVIIPELKVSKISYGDVFLEHLNVNPYQASFDQLKTIAGPHVDIAFEVDDKSSCLDLLMTHCIEPLLPKGLIFIYDYPAEQAALAKLGKNIEGDMVARRFEAYLNGIELANGYFELTDADEQKKRFEKDLDYRKNNNLTDVPYDNQLIEALENGMPECAGVALGIDRLLMSICDVDNIKDVISFSR